MPKQSNQTLQAAGEGEATATEVTRLASRLSELVAQVQEFHTQQKLHLNAGPESLFGLPGGDVRLSEVKLEQATDTSEVVLDSSMLPPELAELRQLSVQRSITATQVILRELRLSLDPRRIDLFNLGRTFCVLAAETNAEEYLRSPTAKSRVPAKIGPIIDACLGYNVEERFADCDQLLVALKPLMGATPVGIRVAEEVTSDTLLSGAHELSTVLGGTDGMDKELPFTSLGHYQVKERIASGGMGDVYRAYDPTLDRDVAIKVLPPAMARNADAVERFTSEAKAVAKLSHPNIVPVYFISSGNPAHYFAMQYIEGPSLADLLADAPSDELALTTDESLRLVSQLAAGLGEAHRHGLIHRDIKPGNVLIDRTRNVAMLADFGLVKAIGSSSQMTAAGVVMGTAHYLSPEQGQGNPVDERSDLYSMGVLLFQLLSGHLPFRGENATAVIFQHAYEKPPALAEQAPHVPKELVQITMRLLEKKPANRVQSASELLKALKRVKLPQRDDKATPYKITPRIAASENRPESAVTRASKIAPNNRGRKRLLTTVTLLALIVVPFGSLAFLTSGAKLDDPVLLGAMAPEPSVSAAELLTSEAWQWTEPENLGPAINTSATESSPWVSRDGRTLLFMSAREGGYGNGDLWVSRRLSPADDWGEPENLGPNINGPHLDVSPSMTADGLILLFDSRREPGPHKGDIYISQRAKTDERWPEAVNLGPPVNTKHNEWNSYISPSGLEIYFSSNRNPAMGFNDLWKTVRPSSSAIWRKPRHLGDQLNSRDGELDARPTEDGTAMLVSRRSRTIYAPRIHVSLYSSETDSYGLPILLSPTINSKGGSNFPFLSADGRTLWFSSPRPGGFGASDLYVTRRVRKKLQEEHLQD